MKRISRTTLIALVATATVLSAAGARALAADPAVICESTKLGAAAKYALCRLKADAKAVKKGLAADYTKCNLAKFATAEVKAGAGACPTENDQTKLQDVLDQYTSRATAVLHSDRFVDNGDGTVTDYQSGLMWEKKNHAGGRGDVDNLYTWSLGAPWESSGTAFTTFLYRVNGGVDSGECLANHCDWRLPTQQELKSIFDRDACATYGDPCIDPIFGPTGLGWYWSSTPDKLNANGAWVVGFDLISNPMRTKTEANYVRAVRAAF